MGTGGSFPVRKVRPERDADHSPPSSAEVKRDRMYSATSHPQTSAELSAPVLSNQRYPLRPSGNCMHHLLQQSVTLHFVFTSSVRFSLQTAIISLNSVNRSIFVTVKCGVFFAVRTESLNIT
jgi:hypothetical protein